jgi:tyrosine-protein kinase Etk/Wzc
MEVDYDLPPNPSDEVDLRDLLNKFRRNKTLIILCVILGGLIAFYATMRAVPLYQAEASIRVESKQSFLGGTRGLATVSNAAEQLSTEREVLHSRALAEAVADSLNLALSVAEPAKVSASALLSNVRVYENAKPGRYEFHRIDGDRLRLVDSGTNNPAKLANANLQTEFGVGEPVLLDGVRFAFKPSALKHSSITLSVVDLHVAAEQVRSATTILQPNRDASIVFIRYRGPDPELARAVPNTLAQQFISRRQLTQKTESRNAVLFLREQLDSLGPQLARAEDSLRKFRESQHIVSLETEGSAQVSRLASLQARYADMEAERAGLAELLSEVQTEDSQRAPDSSLPSPYRRLLSFPSLLGNGGASHLLSSLTAADEQRASLLLRRTTKDPDVIAVTGRIRDIEGQIKDLVLTYLRGLEIETATVNAEISKFGTEMKRVPAKEVTYARLERKPKLLENIYTLLQSRLKEAQIDEGIQDGSVQLLDTALVPTVPVSPKPALNLGLGLTMGLVLGIILAFFREQMDNSVHTREHLRRVTHVPVLGLIPRIEPSLAGGFVSAIAGKFDELPDHFPPWMRFGLGSSGSRMHRARLLQIGTKDKTYIKNTDPMSGHGLRSPIYEAYRGLRTNITFADPKSPPRVLVFTSPMAKDGKTTSVANLAITLSQQGLKVLLIDADMRRSVLHSIFSIPQEPGLSDVLVGAIGWEHAISKVDLWDGGTLDIITSGPSPRNPAELVGSAAMRQLIENTKDSYDMILFDSPPLNLVTDAAVLGTIAHGVVVVARAGRSTNEAMRFAMEQLRHVGAPILGTVLNDIDFQRDARYYGGYGSYAYAYKSGY